MVKNKEDKSIKEVGIPEEEFYLTEGLKEEAVEELKKIVSIDDRVQDFGKRKKENALKAHAKLTGNPYKAIELRNAQLKPVFMSAYNPRIFIGDKCGLGKTVMSAESYAYYYCREYKAGKTPKKVLIVTDNAHVKGFARDWVSFGINVIPLTGSTIGIRRILKKNKDKDFEGIVINWDSLKTNGFLEYFLDHQEEYGFAVFDETSVLMNDKTTIYPVVNNILNVYKGGIERAIFLNGSSFEKNIFDFYNQFRILRPKLIPTKTFLENRYVVREGREIRVKQWVENQQGLREIQDVYRRTGEIVDYRNQEELRERLKLSYIARTKEDYAKDIPKHNYIGHYIEMTEQQKKVLKENNRISLVNSPRTSDSTKELTLKNSPKLQELIRFADQVADDRPIIYAYNNEAQETIKAELEKIGYRVGIVSGKNATSSGKSREDIIEAFEKGQLDMLVINIAKAINLPSSSRVLFYDIPTKPQTTTQVMGRIDRNNLTDIKFYDFFCYLESSEMLNILGLGFFREYHGSKFTGQSENVYQQLVIQLETIYSAEKIAEISDFVANYYETEKNDYEELRRSMANILDIKDECHEEKEEA